MYILNTSDHRYAIMGYDVTERYSKINPLLDEVYLETILNNNHIYLVPIDPLIVSDAEKSIANKLSEAGGHLSAPWKLSFLALAVIAFVLGSNSINDYITKIASQGDGYYELLAFTRIKTQYKGVNLLRKAIQELAKQPDSVRHLLGQFGSAIYGKQVFKTNNEGISLLQSRLSQMSNITPVLLASDRDLQFNESFMNQSYDDPAINLVDNIIDTIQGFIPWIYIGSMLGENILEKVAHSLQSLKKDFQANKISVLKDLTQSVANRVAGLSRSWEDFNNKYLIPLLYYLMMQYKVAFPKIYSNSSRKASVKVTLRLKANSIPDIYDNILVPLLYLEALALPRKYDLNKYMPQDLLGRTMNNAINIMNLLPVYGPSFYVACIIPGKVFIPFGIISNFEVTYDDNANSMIGGQPLVANVSLEIEDLSDVVMYKYPF